MFVKRRELLLLLNYWIFLTSEAIKMGVLPPPSNLTLKWDFFCLRLSWGPPEGLENCTYKVNYSLQEKTGQSIKSFTRIDMYFESCLDLENGVNYTVQTNPNECGTLSEPVVRSIPPQKAKLIKDFKCYYYTSESLNCTWTPENGTKDLQLFYWYKTLRDYKPCSLLLDSGKPGCHLHGEFLQHSPAFDQVFFLFNGTQGSSVIENRFGCVPRQNVKPPPPQLRISESEDKLLLKWDPPRGFEPDCWQYQYRYKTSKQENWVYVPQENGRPKETEASQTYDKRYEYIVQLKAIFGPQCGQGESDWSPEMHYGERQEPDWSLHVVLITIPVLVTVCIIVILVFFKRLRNVILPEIPKPKDLFKNQTSSSVYVPVKEPVCEQVKLVENCRPLVL